MMYRQKFLISCLFLIGLGISQVAFAPAGDADDWINVEDPSPDPQPDQKFQKEHEEEGRRVNIAKLPDRSFGDRFKNFFRRNKMTSVVPEPVKLEFKSPLEKQESDLQDWYEHQGELEEYLDPKYFDRGTSPERKSELYEQAKKELATYKEKLEKASKAEKSAQERTKLEKEYVTSLPENIIAFDVTLLTAKDTSKDFTMSLRTMRIVAEKYLGQTDTENILQQARTSAAKSQRVDLNRLKTESPAQFTHRLADFEGSKELVQAEKQALVDAINNKIAQAKEPAVEVMKSTKKAGFHDDVRRDFGLKKEHGKKFESPDRARRSSDLSIDRGEDNPIPIAVDSMVEELVANSDMTQEEFDKIYTENMAPVIKQYDRTPPGPLASPEKAYDALKKVSKLYSEVQSNPQAMDFLSKYEITLNKKNQISEVDLKTLQNNFENFSKISESLKTQFRQMGSTAKDAFTQLLIKHVQTS